MEADVRIDKVEQHETRSGTTRFVIRDGDGREYTTFRPTIGREALKYEGRRAHIKFHEQERDGFTNVYLDAVDPLEQEAAADADVDEAAWRTAMEAAPYLLSPEARDVPPRELFEKLQPFKELVAEDIEKPDE
jgi:hypothetical protein